MVRCEIDGVINNKGEDQLLSIKVGREGNTRSRMGSLLLSYSSCCPKTACTC